MSEQEKIEALQCENARLKPFEALADEAAPLIIDLGTELAKIAEIIGHSKDDPIPVHESVLKLKDQLTAALARAEVLIAAEEALDGRHPSVVGACTEYRLAEDELPDEFDSEDYCLHKAVASLLRQRDREAKRADAAEKELKHTAASLGREMSDCSILKNKLEAAESKVKELEASIIEHCSAFTEHPLELECAKLKSKIESDAMAYKILLEITRRERNELYRVLDALRIEHLKSLADNRETGSEDGFILHPARLYTMVVNALNTNKERGE